MPEPISRRAFLASASAAGGALLLAGPSRALTPRAKAGQVGLARGGGFGQSVASGQPTPDGITLWSRVDGLERAARLQVEVSPDPDFRRVVWRQTVTARPEENFTVHHRAEARAFAPGERYHYRFYTCDASSPVGRFRLPNPADSREPVRIGFFSCQRWERGYFTPHAALAAEAEDLDLVVCLGDYIYEEPTSRNTAGRVDQTGVNKDAEVQTLPEYRQKYALYHSDPDLLAVRAAAPLLAIWDDHEAENDYAGNDPAVLEQVQRRVPFLERRAAGYRAFFEHMPRIRDPREADRIYGSLRLGRTAELFLLDTRQYRDLQPCRGEQFPERCPDPERFAPGRTLLGAQQREWLKAGLTGSQATWKLVGNQVMLMGLDIPRGNAANPDQWDGYAAERQELMQALLDRGTENVSFLTGDIHVFFAGEVTPTGRQDAPGFPAAAATEFVGGSVTSSGLTDDTGIREESVDAPVNAGVQANNPHIRYFNGNIKGYGVLTATPNELRVDYRGVRTVEAPKSESYTLASFRVRSGTNRVEVLDLPV